ncbi:MAG: hypothetical protein H6744_14630 [Deltaproteobacteria bacterium]|nr:hypothetical protein [Deltaproteobacteria bacterium]
MHHATHPEPFPLRLLIFPWFVPLLVGACSASGGSPGSTPDAGAGTDGGVVLLDVGVTPDAIEDRDGTGPDILGCPNGCAEAYPVVPRCMKTSWDVKACTCSLKPADDGTPCDDEEACTIEDACVAGACMGGKSGDDAPPTGGFAPEGTPLLRADAPGYEAAPIYVAESCRSCDRSRAYMHFWDGGSLNGRRMATAPDGKGGLVTADLLTRLNAYDAGLDWLWSARPSASPQFPVSTRLVRMPSGGYVTCGVLYAALGAWTGQGWVSSATSDGTLLWELVLDAESLLDVGAIVVAEGGDLFVLAQNQRAWLYRLTADGDVVWRADLGESGIQDGITTSTMAFVTPSRLVATHMKRIQTAEGVRFDTQVSAVDLDGNILWQDGLLGSGFFMASGPVAPLQSGHALLIGAHGDPEDFTAFPALDIGWMTLDSSGEVLATGSLPLPGQDPRQVPFIREVVEMPDGGLVVTGYDQRQAVENGPVQQEGFLLKLDAWANFEWMRFYGGAARDELMDVIVSESGTITAVGSLNVFGATGGVEAFILRTDFWGRTCGMRLGVCADMPWQDCEDGNPCTINWCDPDQGCTHPPLPDGSPCDIGKTCQGAVCK